MIHLKGEENMFFMHPEPTSLVEVMLQISEFLMIMNLHVKMPSCIKLEVKKMTILPFQQAVCSYLSSSGGSTGEPTCILIGSSMLTKTSRT